MAEVEVSDSFWEYARRAGIPHDHWLERIVTGLKQELQANPEAYPEVPGSGLRAAYTRGFEPAVPPYCITYSYDGRVCKILAIRSALRSVD